jgi:RNA polymerase sigma-70 factor (ECF subfamily)
VLAIYREWQQFLQFDVTNRHPMQRKGTMNELTIHKLMSQYRETGRADDLGELFDEVAPTLFQTALHLSLDPQAAEDLLQETFLAIMGSMKRWNPKKKAAPWITGILRREAQNKGRRDRRRPAPENLPQRDSIAPSVATENLERNTLLRDAVNTLPDLYREVVGLVLTEGAAPSEIAARLNSTPGTIRTRLHRGIALLRKSLPTGVAIPGVLLAFQSTSFGAVRSSILAQSVPTKTAVVTPALLAKAAIVAAAIVLVVGVVVETRAFLMDDGEESLTQNEAVDSDSSQQATESGDTALIARRNQSNDDFNNKTEVPVGLKTGKTVAKRNSDSAQAKDIRRGSFAMHFKQGYSFAIDGVVPEAESDVWFKSCAGGISSILYTSRLGIATYPQSIGTKRLGETRCSADCYFRSVISVDVEKVAWGELASCDNHTGHSDVFVVKTQGGGYALCVVRERLADSGWTKNKAVVDYVWNPKAPVFHDDRKWTKELAGFAIDTDAFLTDPALEAIYKKTEDQVARLDGLIAKYETEHGANYTQGRIGVVLYDDLAQDQTPDWRLATRYSTIDFSKGARSEHTSRKRWDGDFEYQYRGEDNLRLCTVTDDRSVGWALGNRDLGAWTVTEIGTQKPKKWLRASRGDLFVLHTLDSRVDRWTEVKILAVIKKEAIVFAWQSITDANVIDEIMEALRDPNSEMKRPEVRIQIRGGAGGGNPNRAFFNGTKNAYVDRIVAAPFDTQMPVSISERHRAWIDGGLIPYGKVWVVTGVDYDATCKGDSNGSGEFIVTIGGKKIVKFRNEKQRQTGSWEGQITLKPGEEEKCFVEIANSSSASVIVRGYFKDN